MAENNEKNADFSKTDEYGEINGQVTEMLKKHEKSASNAGKTDSDDDLANQTVDNDIAMYKDVLNYLTKELNDD